MKTMSLIKLLIATVLLSGFSVFSQENAEEIMETSKAGGNSLTVDVACDGFSFIPWGDNFVISGYIYPAGTLTDSNGVLPEGGPEFPELIIGIWTCRGWVITERPTHVNQTTTTTFEFNLEINERDGLADVYGIDMLHTVGLEYTIGDVNAPVLQRAVIGGTGMFDREDGTCYQHALGANASGAFNFTFEFPRIPASRLN
jgi:hypothetical protein